MKSKIIPFILLLSVVSCEKESSDDLRNDFVGNWLVNENSKLLGQRTYLVTLSKDSLSDAQIIIDNFYKIGEGENVISSISTTESNTITIPGQNIKNNYISLKEIYRTIWGRKPNIKRNNPFDQLDVK